MVQSKSQEMNKKKCGILVINDDGKEYSTEIKQYPIVRNTNILVLASMGALGIYIPRW